MTYDKGSMRDLLKKSASAVTPEGVPSTDLEERFRKDRLPKKVKLSCYIDARLEQAIVDLARKTGRSASSLVETILSDAIDIKPNG